LARFYGAPCIIVTHC